MAGVSAYHLFRRTDHVELFTRSLRIGVFTACVGLVLSVITGGMQFELLGEIQPLKIAAFGGDAAEVDETNDAVAEWAGDRSYAPPALARAGGVVMLLAFAAMLWLLVAGAMLALSRRAMLRFRAWHVVMMASIPLPYIAMIAGWVFREVGRQPWVVYEMLTVEEAVSDVSDAAMRMSLLTFTVLFAVLIVVTVSLLARHARRGPGAGFLGRVPDEHGSRDPSGAVLTFVGK